MAFIILTFPDLLTFFFFGSFLNGLPITPDMTERRDHCLTLFYIYLGVFRIFRIQEVQTAACAVIVSFTSRLRTGGCFALYLFRIVYMALHWHLAAFHMIPVSFALSHLKTRHCFGSRSFGYPFAPVMAECRNGLRIFRDYLATFLTYRTR